MLDFVTASLIFSPSPILPQQMRGAIILSYRKVKSLVFRTVPRVEIEASTTRSSVWGDQFVELMNYLALSNCFEQRTGLTGVISSSESHESFSA